MDPEPFAFQKIYTVFTFVVSEPIFEYRLVILETIFGFRLVVLRTVSGFRLGLNIYFRI